MDKRSGKIKKFFGLIFSRRIFSTLIVTLLFVSLHAVTVYSLYSANTVAKNLRITSANLDLTLEVYTDEPSNPDAQPIFTQKSVDFIKHTFVLSSSQTTLYLKVKAGSTALSYMADIGLKPLDAPMGSETSPSTSESTQNPEPSPASETTPSTVPWETSAGFDTSFTSPNTPAESGFEPDDLESSFATDTVAEAETSSVWETQAQITTTPSREDEELSIGAAPLSSNSKLSLLQDSSQPSVDILKYSGSEYYPAESISNTAQISNGIDVYRLDILGISSDAELALTIFMDYRDSEHILVSTADDLVAAAGSVKTGSRTKICLLADIEIDRLLLSAPAGIDLGGNTLTITSEEIILPTDDYAVVWIVNGVLDPASPFLLPEGQKVAFKYNPGK